MSQVTYEAAVYSRTVKYRNYKGEDKTAELFFALDPIQLMQVIAGFRPGKNKRSKNPNAPEVEVEMTDEQQLKFVRDLAAQSAGFPSEDGETWHPYDNFLNDIAGKAFMTKLTSSDKDRREFAEKVIIDPFKAYVDFAASDPDNDKADVQQFQTMLKQLENVFLEKPDKNETLEERRARLAAEMAALDSSDS